MNNKKHPTIYLHIGVGYEPINWQRREDIGETSVLDKMQQLRKRKIDDSFICIRIEYLSRFDIFGEGNMKDYIGVEVL